MELNQFLKVFSFLVLILELVPEEVNSTETPSPEKFLLPRHYNPHPYKKDGSTADEVDAASKYLQRFSRRQTGERGRKGPVLFPNDTSPPPRRPLVVTSRPLTEQIARSDRRGTIQVSKTPATNAQQITAEDYQNSIPDANSNNYFLQQPNPSLRYGQYQNPIRNPNFMKDARGNPNLAVVYNGILGPNELSFLDADGNIRPVGFEDVLYNGVPIRTGSEGSPQGLPNRLQHTNGTVLDNHPYAEIVKKSKQRVTNGRPGYDSFEEQTVVPPIYKALGKYAKSKALNKASKGKQNQAWRQRGNYGVQSRPEENDYYTDNSANEDKHYAFSYSVKDHDTGDDFSHSQRHTGSGTNGEYRVKLPDGRVQIVSYTADNGGYKADVRYEDDPEATNNQNQQEIPYNPVIAQPQTNGHNRYIQGTSSKLGRIVVPSQEDNDYQDADYFYGSVTTKAPLYNVVTNDANEVLITSKPGFLYTPSTIPPYNRFTYNNRNNKNYQGFTATPTPLVYITPTTSSHFGQDSNRHNIYSTTMDPQEASKTYSHFYNAESVKFVSTTPKYGTLNRNSLAPSNNRASTTKRPTTVNNRRLNGGYSDVTSTVAPILNSYDHLDAPEVVVKIEPRPKSTVRYTSLAPILYNAISGSSSTTEATPIYEDNGEDNASPTPESLPLGRYYAGSDSIDLRRYFTFTK